MDRPTSPSGTPEDMANTPILRLTTCLWWTLAEELSFQDLSTLRLVSRGIENETHQPYLKRCFTSVTVTSASYLTKLPIYGRELQAVHAVVRSLTLTRHLVPAPTNGKFIPGRITAQDGYAVLVHNMKFSDEGTSAVVAATAADYVPLDLISSLVNLEVLDIQGLVPEWLDLYLPDSTLGSVVATREKKIKQLRFCGVHLSVERLVNLLTAFRGSVEVLTLEFYSGTELLSGKWPVLFRMLATLELRTLNIMLKVGMKRGGPGLALYTEPSFEHCNKWLGGKETYVLHAGNLTATGKRGVDAALHRAVEWFEAEYPQV
ncbi:hypothetical protein LTR15_010086 [Elasticomyces elasticus]|nr:hypothetical protein LTR15_010086 [Elasticomyces elasticus]